MAFIVEDGSIVANANSYVTEQELVNYASDRGITIPTESSAREQMLVKATDYIDGKYRRRFQGAKVNRNQSLQWPRVNVYVDCFYLPFTQIPVELKEAVIEAAISSQNTPLYQDSTGTNVRKERVAELEVEYFAGGNFGGSVLQKVSDMVEPLLRNGGAKRLLRT